MLVSIGLRLIVGLGNAVQVKFKLNDGVGVVLPVVLG